MMPDDNPIPGTRRVAVGRICDGERSEIWETVVEELPLTVRLNGREWTTLLHSAGDEENLVRGFLAAEGLIQALTDVYGLELNLRQGTADVTIAEAVADRQRGRRAYLSACCGRGRQGFYFLEDMALAAGQPLAGPTLTVNEIYRYFQALEQASGLFAATGGVHNGLLCRQGQVLRHSQDVGRHNVLDKLYGWALTEQADLTDCIIVFSGRISGELVIKLARMGVTVLAARSAPTALAIDMAEALGITLTGFVRGTRMNVYTHGGRIKG